MPERIRSAINGIGENDAIQCRQANYSFVVLIFSSQAADVRHRSLKQNSTTYLCKTASYRLPALNLFHEVTP